MTWIFSPLLYQTWSTRPVLTSSPGHPSLLILVTFPYGQGSVQITSNLKQLAQDITQGKQTLFCRVASRGFHGTLVSQTYVKQCESHTNKKTHDDKNYLPLIWIFNRLPGTKLLHNPTHSRVPPCNQNVSRSVIRSDRLSHTFHFVPLAMCVNSETQISSKG